MTTMPEASPAAAAPPLPWPLLLGARIDTDNGVPVLVLDQADKAPQLFALSASALEGLARTLYPGELAAPTPTTLRELLERIGPVGFRFAFARLEPGISEEVQEHRVALAMDQALGLLDAFGPTIISSPTLGSWLAGLLATVRAGDADPRRPPPAPSPAVPQPVLTEPAQGHPAPAPLASASSSPSASPAPATHPAASPSSRDPWAGWPGATPTPAR